MTTRKKITNTTGLSIRRTVEGETIEMKIERIVNNNEPIDEIAPTIYQPRGEGVKPEYDVRTDRWELGLDAMSAIERSMITRRMEYHKGTSGDETTEGTEANNLLN